MNENKRIKRLTDQNTRLLGEVAELKEKLAAEKAK